MCGIPSATSATASCAASRQRHQRRLPVRHDVSGINDSFMCGASRSCRASRPLWSRHRRRLFRASCRAGVSLIAAGPAARSCELSAQGVRPVSCEIRWRPPRALSGFCPREPIPGNVAELYRDAYAAPAVKRAKATEQDCDRQATGASAVTSCGRLLTARSASGRSRRT